MSRDKEIGDTGWMGPATLNPVYAFPVPGEAFDPGMEMRDYFAGQALRVADEVGGLPDYDVAAEDAYSMADAMMKERSK